MERRQFFGSVAAMFAAGSASFTYAKEPLINNDLKWRNELIVIEPHNRALRRPVITGVSLQPQGDLLAIVGDDHFVCLFDQSKGKFVEHLNNHNDWIRATRFSPNGQQLVTAGNDRTLQLWNAGSWDRPTFVRRHPGAIIEVAFSPDGTKLATVGFEKKLRVYDTSTMEVIQTLECSCEDNHALTFSNQGDRLAAAGRCGNIRVWDTGTWKQTSQFKAHRNRIRSMQFTSTGTIVSAGDDQMIRMTKPDNPQGAVFLPRMASKLFATALIGDEIIATGGSDNKVHLWQTNTLREMGVLTGHTGTVSCLDYQKGRLVSGSFDTHVRLWTTEQNASAPALRHTQRQGWGQKLK